jgi:hypothetical protein
MSSYAEELEFSLDKEVHFENDVDSAIDFLFSKERKNDGQIELIVLDVMMSHGKTFEAESTEYGLRGCLKSPHLCSLGD